MKYKWNNENWHYYREPVRLCWGQQDEGLDPSVMKLRDSEDAAKSDVVLGDLMNNDDKGMKEYIYS